MVHSNLGTISFFVHALQCAVCLSSLSGRSDLQGMGPRNMTVPSLRIVADIPPSTADDSNHLFDSSNEGDAAAT